MRTAGPTWTRTRATGRQVASQRPGAGSENNLRQRGAGALHVLVDDLAHVGVPGNDRDLDVAVLLVGPCRLPEVSARDDS